MQDPHNYEKPFQPPNHILWIAVNQTFEKNQSRAACPYILVPGENGYFLHFTAPFFFSIIFHSLNPTNFEHLEYQ